MATTIAMEENSDKLRGDEHELEPPQEQKPKGNAAINQLASGDVLRTMLKIAIPSAIGMLSVTLYNTFDSVVVGQALGDLQLTALSNFLPTEFFFGSQPIVSASNGASAIISGYIGQQNLEKAAMAQAQFFYVGLIHSLVIPLIFLPWLPTYLRMLGVTEQVLPYTLQYGYLMMALAPFVYSISTGIPSLLKCQNKAQLVMLRQMIGAGLNLGLDVLFMVPIKLGIRGAAVATITAYTITGGWIIMYLFSKRAVLKMTRKSFAPEFGIILKIYQLGFPTYLNYVPASLNQLLSTVLIKAFSRDIAETQKLQMVSGIANRVLGLLTMPQNGLLTGIQPLLGYNIGAKNVARTKKVLKVGYLLILGTGATFFLAVELFAPYIVRAFTKSEDVWENAAAMTRLNCAGVFLGLFLQIAVVILQQEKKVATATWLNLAKAILALSVSIVLPWAFHDARYIFFSNFIADCFAGVAGIVYLIVIVRRYRHAK